MKVGLCVLIVLGVLAGAGPYLWIRFATTGRVHPVAEAPDAPVAIVLGAGLRADGSPKPYLRIRLEDTLRLYEDGKVRAILVSGDHGQVDYDEVAAMTSWLVEHGVPAGKVVADHAGFDTYDSCVRAHEIFGVRAALVVTQEFHVRRAVFLCRAAGIDAAGVGSPPRTTTPATRCGRCPRPSRRRSTWSSAPTPSTSAGTRPASTRRCGLRRPGRWPTCHACPTCPG